MKNNKGFAGVGILIAIIVVLALGGAYYLGKHSSTSILPFGDIEKSNPVKELQNDIKNVPAGYQKAKIINLTGVDGCGYEIELSNGQRLEPTNLSSEFKKDSLPVLIKYKEKSVNSVCMIGKGIELTDIKIDSDVINLPVSILKLTTQDTGKSFTVAKGQTIIIKVGNPEDLGYQNTLQYNSSILQLINKTNDTSMVPAGSNGNFGYEIYTFKTLTNGTSNLNVIATNGQGKTMDMFSSTIVVQ